MTSTIVPMLQMLDPILEMLVRRSMPKLAEKYPTRPWNAADGYDIHCPYVITGSIPKPPKCQWCGGHNSQLRCPNCGGPN